MNDLESTPTPPPLVSIIVVTYNALDYVRMCLEGIRTRTHLSFELIVVDNASEKETRDYLKSIDRITLVLNQENKLWVAACNQGMRASDPRSRYLLILNSDIEFKRDDWLDVMLTVLESDPKVGIVGPGHFMMPHAPMYGFIDGWCMLFRRELLNEIGYWDEVRWPWTCAEIDFSVAAFAAGWTYKVVNTRDAILVHHRHKSHTPEMWSQVRLNYTSPEHRPKIQYVNIMKEHGLQPSLAVTDRILAKLYATRVLWRLKPYLDRGRFYYSEPVGRLPKGRYAASPDVLHTVPPP